MAMAEWMIETYDVTKSFGQTRALDGVSFVVGEGEILGLLGPNGAGKTTLVRALATLLVPDRGSLRIGGVDVRREPSAVRRLLGLAGQAAAVDELLTGRENLELIGALYGLPRDLCRERAAETLERFDLVDAADRRVGRFSGGMRRRLDLGATLIGRPSVILLDEPTAGLDPRSRNELWAFVEQITADGTTILLTSQYLEEVERLADQIVVIDRGVVIADAPPAELKTAVVDEVLEARLADSADLGKATALLHDLGDTAPAVNPDDLRLSLATTAGIPALVTAARRLDGAGIGLIDLAIRRPSLDDVFLALTGDAAVVDPIHVARNAPAKSITAPSARRDGHPLRDMAVVTGRYVRRFTRTPQMFIFGAAQPVALVLGLNAAFGGLVELVTGESYIQYLLPGVIVMHVLFGGSITSAGIAEDLQAGIIDRFRSLPMNRAAVLVGRTAADLLRNAVSLALAIAVGVALGFRVRGSVIGAVAGIVLVLAFSYAISWLFACIGMVVRTPQAAQLAGFLPALPLAYLSGAWIPVESMSSAVQAFARNQPVTVLVATLRSVADGSAVADTAWQAVAWTIGILAVSIPLAVWLYRGDGD
jgi:ABC transporter DrrB family efflux protein